MVVDEERKCLWASDDFAGEGASFVREIVRRIVLYFVQKRDEMIGVRRYRCVLGLRYSRGYIYL